MCALKERLEKLCFEVEKTAERFANDDNFYVQCLSMVLNDAGFDDLGKALCEFDSEKSFSIAHSLKGMAANVGAIPLLKTLDNIVEPLRCGNVHGLEQSYNELLTKRDEIKWLVEN